MNWSIKAIGIALAIFLGGILCTQLFETNDADEILCIQNPVSGNLRWYTDAGIKWQGFGKMTSYYKLETYEFELPCRFNDGGHGTIIGSMNYQMPLDVVNLTKIHVNYGSMEAVQKQLVETVVNKCVYMTGPLMSSKESYAEKRTSLINYIEDQIQNGIFRTIQKDVKTKDPITNLEKTVTVVELVQNQTGLFERQEKSVLTDYGIKTSNFAVTKLPYDATVEEQIKQQQALMMKVQTAVASAREAEQRSITVAKEGEANAAKAKWEQEVIKAKMVTEAQQQLEVATLNAKAAEQTKREQVLLGEGEGTRKRLVMQADGGLDPKLQTLKEINAMWADAFSKFQGNFVPSVIMGENGGKSGSVTDLVNMMMLNNARQVGVDMGVTGRSATAR